MRDDLPALIAQAEANGQVTGLLTDGLKLIDAEYLNTLLVTGLDHLMVILDPKEPLVWKALEKILPEDIFTTVHITIDHSETIDITQILSNLASLGVNAISLSDIEPGLDEALLGARDLVAELGVPLVWDLPVPYSTRNPVALESAEDKPPDGAGKAWLYVEPDGDIFPAQGVNQVLGNLLRDKWEVIWN
jgi:MoaA/NifB/PqqE/SkfB family radical SAM enzyme